MFIIFFIIMFFILTIIGLRWVGSGSSAGGWLFSNWVHLHGSQEGKVMMMAIIMIHDYNAVDGYDGADHQVQQARGAFGDARSLDSSGWTWWIHPHLWLPCF